MELRVKILMSTHIFVYRLTGGLLGGRMAGQTVLLLQTDGRKSGKRYTTPINYYPDGESYVVVASNWGKDHHPGWFRNLQHQPLASIQVRNRKMQVKAHEATGTDYDRLWQVVTGKNAFYNRYQAQTERKIPLVLLTPVHS